MAHFREIEANSILCILELETISTKEIIGVPPESRQSFLARLLSKVLFQPCQAFQGLALRRPVLAQFGRCKGWHTPGRPLSRVTV